MQAIEFSSIVHNGAIPIPEQYRDKIGSSVKVIVFPNDTRQNEGKTQGAFHCIGIDMTGFQFNREEANER
jgi:hypothetical protein